VVTLFDEQLQARLELFPILAQVQLLQTVTWVLF